MLNENKKIGECEVCPRTDVEITLHYGNMWFCDECWEKDQKLSAENNTPAKQQERVDAMNDSMNNAVIRAREIDNSIQVRTDLFNAATVSIISLKAEIDNDATIENKPFRLASELKNRFEHFKTVIFEMNEKIVEAGNEQKAIQVYLNQLANSLRTEEREKLKISDINYKPTPPKSIKVPTLRTKTSKKLDKTELKKYAMELGIPEFTLQMLVVSKGITVETAANMLRKSINDAKASTKE